MSTAFSPALMRLLAVALLLLFRSDTAGRAHVPEPGQHSSHSSIAAANHAALLAASPVRHVVDTAPLLLASDATVLDCRVQPTPAPSRDSSSLCSYERATSQSARPPPFQA